MLSWIGNAVSDIADWLGDGIASFFNWLFGGISTVLTKVIYAFNTVFDLFDSLFDFVIGVKDKLMLLLHSFLPFIPDYVFVVLGLSLTATIVIAIVRLVKK